MQFGCGLRKTVRKRKFGRRTGIRTTRLVRFVSCDIEDYTLDRDIAEATVYSCTHLSISFPGP